MHAQMGPVIAAREPCAGWLLSGSWAIVVPVRCPVHEVSGMHFMERFEHKGVVFFVDPDREEGFYSFRFMFNKKTVRGRTKTRLRGMAIQRARRAIDRILREQR
jgi:hypothetical protein